MNRSDILDMEEHGCFNFFYNEVTKSGTGIGLIRDNTGKNAENVCSIASVGFGLSAIPIGVKRGWITYEEGYKRALDTVKTLYNDVDKVEGFLYHFVDMRSGKRVWNCEVSIIDTTITLMGMLTAAEFFGGEVEKYFELFYSRINWQWYTDKKKNMFYMGYSRERGFFGLWDAYAEQIMMYVMGAGSPSYSIDPEMYYTFKRNTGCYGGEKCIYTAAGAAFTYQYSHAWIDFRNLRDRFNVNWFENSISAIKANQMYCLDNPEKFKTFGKNSWGMTASDSPSGYRGNFGAPPSSSNNCAGNDGTIAPYGAAGSIVFTPGKSIDAMNYYYENHNNLWGKYGFKDAYNLDVSPNWYSDIEIGIDKGISLVMIENYRTGLIWEIVMKNKYIKKGIELLELRPEKDTEEETA